MSLVFLVLCAVTGQDVEAHAGHGAWAKHRGSLLAGGKRVGAMTSSSALQCRVPVVRRSTRRWLARRPSQRLVDVRVKSAKSYTRLVLVMRGVVSGINHDYIPQRKGFPPRVYIDLTPSIPLRKWSRVPYWVGDSHIGRVRIARNTRRTTRVVLELRRKARYRVKILQRPMRVVIDVARRRFPRRFGARSPLPTVQPRPWRSRYRRRRRPPSSSQYALRHRGPLPKIPDKKRFVLRRIAIDPGHGGPEDGAVGRRTGLREKTLTLDIAKRVVRKLRRLTKVKVTLLRRSDRQVSLSQRASLAQRRKADLLVSIHINAHTDRKVSGISTYILDWNSRSFAARLLSSDPLTARENQGVHPKRFTGGAVGSILASLRRQYDLSVARILAIAVQQSMVKQVKKLYPSIKDLGVRKGLFYLLFAAQMPAILVEASYLSNPKEERLLRTQRYREQIAVGITKGLVRFIKHAKK